MAKKSKKVLRGKLSPFKPKSRLKVKCTFLVHVDTNKIASDYRKKCLRTKTLFEKSKKNLEFHEKEEHPAYVRWIRNLSGPMISELKELNDESAQKEDLLNELEYKWRRSRGRSRYECYFYHLRDIENQEREEREDAERAKSNSENDRQEYHGGERCHDGDDFDDDYDDFEEDDFEDDDFEDDDYDYDDDYYNDFKKTFGDFSQFMKGLLGDEYEDYAADKFVAEKTKKIKDLYRVICRKLHPDTGVEFDEHTSSLWHDTQDAYQKKDVARLEAILAICEMNSPKAKFNLTCSQIIAVIEHYENGKKSIASLLRKAKKSVSWGFLSWDEKKKDKVLKQCENELLGELAMMRNRVRILRNELEKWTTPPCPSKEPKPAKSQTASKKGQFILDPGQMSFNF